MKDIEEQILRYPDLSSEEQEAVDEYVAQHPRRQALLRDVKALEQLLAEARSLGADALPSGEVLAHYLATPRTGSLPPALKAAFEDIEAALADEQHGQELRARLEALARRLRTLEAENRDPAAHFEALTGHSLAEGRLDASETERSEEPTQEETRTEIPTQETKRSRRATKFWALLHLALLPHWARYSAAFALVLAVLYGGLFAGGRLAQSDMERLAALNEDRLSVEGYGLRGMRTRGGGGSLAPSDSASLDARYLRSLRLLRKARTSTLGLFPRYDEATARRAESQLEAISREAEGGSFVQLEALFFLGKARLALGDKGGATKALRQVVAGGGRLAPEAQEILETLYEDAAYDGPPAGG